MNAKPYLSLAAAAITILPVGQLLAQATGTSHPESDNEIVATGGSHYLKPSPAAPRTPAAASDSTAYGSYQPYVATPQPATVIIQPVTMPATPTTPSSVADASVVYGPYQPYVAPGQTRQLATRPSDTDALIAGVVPTGTTLTGVLQQTISTKTTPEGTHFLAIITVPILRDGVIVVPAGSLLKGRVVRIHGGRRISGPPQIRMKPETITLLDGSVYPLTAEVASLEHFYPAHVNHEGTIVGTSSGKNTALAFGLVTASATASGALAGGSIGAVVGFGVGAGIATAWWLRQDRLVEVPGGTKMVFTLDSPLQINPAAR
jgi:hypothetical protein